MRHEKQARADGGHMHRLRALSIDRATAAVPPQLRQALFSRVHDMQRAPELMRLITNEKVRRYRFRVCFCLLSCIRARACSWRFCLACGSCPPSL